MKLIYQPFVKNLEWEALLCQNKTLCIFKKMLLFMDTIFRCAWSPASIALSSQKEFYYKSLKFLKITPNNLSEVIREVTLILRKCSICNTNWQDHVEKLSMQIERQTLICKQKTDSVTRCWCYWAAVVDLAFLSHSCLKVELCLQSWFW